MPEAVDVTDPTTSSAVPTTSSAVDVTVPTGSSTADVAVARTSVPPERIVCLRRDRPREERADPE